ncbi:hypothetical protein [Primorskyibacter sp. S187A]|uniref:hypothetical protein n=1 Tax=Primorskyibacter sp. S187A TaxID=3415130 RepID=UPI003C7A61C4
MPASNAPPPEVIAEMYAPPGRRWLGVGMLYGLGLLLLTLGALRPPDSVGWVVFLFATGALAIWGGEKMRQSTALGLRLTDDGLWDTSGRRIVSLDEIENVDRGVFAFKPSNGFLLKTRDPVGRSWRPGLYWTMGRRIGVGGVTSRAQAKLMSDTITMILAERRVDEMSDD